MSVAVQRSVGSEGELCGFGDVASERGDVLVVCIWEYGVHDVGIGGSLDLEVEGVTVSSWC